MLTEQPNGVQSLVFFLVEHENIGEEFAEHIKKLCPNEPNVLASLLESYAIARHYEIEASEQLQEIGYSVEDIDRMKAEYIMEN